MVTLRCIVTLMGKEGVLCPPNAVIVEQAEVLYK